MIGRGARRLVFGMLVVALVAPALSPRPARAQAESQPTAAAYDAIGRWLFDLYLNQSIRLTVANVAQARPDAPVVLGPQMPAIAKVLDRHRDDFIRAMRDPLRAHFNHSDAATFATRLAKPPIDIDDTTRARLVAVDADFRRDGQKAIRAITFDLGIIVTDALAAAPASRQN